MQNNTLPKGYKIFLDILNQIFEVEKKLEKIQEQNSIKRNLNRLKELFEHMTDEGEMGFIIENPIGEAYDETRIDCEANIAGEGIENLAITEVIKPIIRYKQGGVQHIVQKGIVIVETRKQ